MLKRTKLIPLFLLLIGIVSTLAFSQPLQDLADLHTPKTQLLVTPTPSLPINETAASGPPLSLTLSLLCFCIVLLLLIGVFVLGIAARRSGSTEDKL